MNTDEFNPSPTAYQTTVRRQPTMLRDGVAEPTKITMETLENLVKLNKAKDLSLEEILSQCTEVRCNQELAMWITLDEKMEAVKRKITKICYMSSYDKEIAGASILITGPTGTGKEILARAFSKGGPFVDENCAAIPAALAESIFFGHKKGSFTGAITDHTGLLEEASSATYPKARLPGIIFLDEVGDMSLELQAKFLRAIQEKKIRRIGDIEPRRIDCRFIAATKYNLRERVKSGHFRDDLYARLSMINIKVTGLSERLCDIAPIAKMYGIEIAIPDRCLEYIEHYNVRAIQSMAMYYKIHDGLEGFEM